MEPLPKSHTSLCCDLMPGFLWVTNTVSSCLNREQAIQVQEAEINNQAEGRIIIEAVQILDFYVEDFVQ